MQHTGSEVRGTGNEVDSGYSAVFVSFLCSVCVRAAERILNTFTHTDRAAVFTKKKFYFEESQLCSHNTSHSLHSLSNSEPLRKGQLYVHL